MCVIVVKKAGIRRPSYNMLKACAQANPDGFGFCTPTKNFKSMSFEDFFNHIQQVTDEEPCIMHFRWATHGSKVESNCHPFYDDVTGTWFAHNGILPVHPIGDWTDSETAFRTLLVPVIEKKGYRSKAFKNKVDEIIGSSKFAFLKGNKLQLFGDFKPYFGYMCSNLHFLGYIDHTYWW